MTGYSAVLFEVVFSQGTGFTRTLTEVFAPNGGWPLFATLNVTVFVSPDWMIGIVSVAVIGVGVFSIVSVTCTETSWEAPVFCTKVWNASAGTALIVCSVS